MKKISIITTIIISLILLFAFEVSAACWDKTTQSTCESSSDEFECNWQSDPGSNFGWCTEKGCWNFWNQSACDAGEIPGKTCSWVGGGVNYGCEKVSCWSFSGTSESSCENNNNDLSCNWNERCYSIGNMGSSGINCWDVTNSTLCGQTQGCTWGECQEQGCWSGSNTNSTYCNAIKDMNGKNCTWNSTYNSCQENGCWRYNVNEANCSAMADASDINCEWKWNSCQNKDCWSFDFTNESACEANSLDLACNWEGSFCMKQDCWSYTTSETCSALPECSWKARFNSGWCEEEQCWSFDSMKGGTQTTCEAALDSTCAWTGNPPGNTTNGWCYKDNSGTSCENITSEKSCMDTYYCWWQYDDRSNPSLGGNCNTPGGESIHKEWNPGCYIFNLNQTACEAISGCTYNVSESECQGDEGFKISCENITESDICNTLPALSRCCSWQGDSCTTDRYSDSSNVCKTQMEAPPAGAETCEDYAAYSDKDLCEQIANAPWFKGCVWNNETEKCGLNSDDFFGGGSASLAKINNQEACTNMEGKWNPESYCQGNISIPTGRCESDEKNCNKACYACELKDSEGQTINSSNAETACEGSNTGICEFSADTNAPNGIGYCNSKQEFKKGISEDCNSNCGGCNFKGDSESDDITKRPSYYCSESKANSDGGGCKWIDDEAVVTGGYCIKKGDKTCEDSCDRCKSQDDCSNLGRTSGGKDAGSCMWEGDTNTGSCIANIEGDAEICWDGEDNNDNALVDCKDAFCYSDSYCGNVEGDCFGWLTDESCSENGCEWVTDKWGSWCDFNGSQCWRYNVNEINCSSQDTCAWKNDSYSNGWCENDWSIGETCMGLGQIDCTNETNTIFGCNWTADSWCMGQGNSSDWCQNDNAGWCDYEAFKPKNCWNYMNSSSCNIDNDCSWYSDSYGQPHCEMDMSANCNQYNDNSSCSAISSCKWKSDQWGSWCDNAMNECWSATTSSTCNLLGSKCSWQSYGMGSGSCQSSCTTPDASSSSACNAISGCFWKEESGWCQESGGCWNFDQTSCSNGTGQDNGCRWKDSGWCNPLNGFSSGSNTGGGGGGAFGGDCWKYDGNETTCTNKTLTGISCSWMSEINPRCDVDWSNDCKDYTSFDACDLEPECWWNDQYGSGFCTNAMDQCWNNQSYQSGSNPDGWLGNCTSNSLCTNNSWGSCEPKCSSLNSTSCTNETYEGVCKYMTGWCTPGAVGEMFTGMESGAPVPIGSDDCPDEGVQSSVDLCGFGMKDMGDSYGFGTNVLNFENASACNREKLSSERIGNGNETVKLFVYLDTDGSTTGGCSLSDNSSATGYEFRLKYVIEWNSTLGNAAETFNAYKCTDSNWETTDIKLSTWKKKMCSEIGGPIIAIKKDDLVKYPTLYDSTKDMRIYVATAGNTGNISSPLDSAGPEWITPGSVDFDIESCNDYGTDTAKFEDIKRKGHVSHENCFGDVDVDGDDLVGCDDYDCWDEPQCSGRDYSNDTRSPQVVGVKIEEYPDAALVMYDTNKLTNGTLLFYGNDSQCLTLNESIYDSTTKTSVRDYLSWHDGKIYNDNSVENISLNFDLEPDTTYYYKLKVCDSNNKCAISKCSSIKTPSEEECGYCDFVTRIKTPSDWDVSYDLNADGTYEHVQGEVCGPTSGMKTNYTSGRRSNVKLSASDGSVYIELLNVSLTKTGLSDKVRTISDAGDIISNSAIVGMTSETRDKIINNLHPEACRIKIPTAADGSCDTLYHCDEAGENCVDRTAAAGGDPINATECIWNVPYCEFSTYRVPESDDDGGDDGSGGSSGSGAKNVADPVSGFILTNVAANGEAKFVFDLTKVPVSEVNFVTNTELLNAKITVTSVKTETASAAVGAINGKVFQYLKIEKAGFGDNIFGKANIKFKVDKAWLTQNVVDKNNIAFYRFENSWGILTTTMLSEDVNAVYYSAETSGFSYFAIGEKTTAPLPGEQQTGETSGSGDESTTEDNEGVISKQTNSIIVLVVLVILILGLIGFFMLRGKKH